MENIKGTLRPVLNNKAGLPKGDSGKMFPYLDRLPSYELKRIMPQLPSVYLKCASMIMDSANFRIDYVSNFPPRGCKNSPIIPASETSLGLKSPSEGRAVTNSGHQISQSSYRAKRELSQKSGKQSNVFITMQYLGTGLSVRSELINPKDELRMFQQVCGGENICVYKGYLSPGETFQFISKRHCGFQFSASIYINGLIAARISACCEYRYHVGFQQGKSGCFRVVRISGGQPCYRCVEFHNQISLQPKEGNVNSSGSSSEHSSNNREAVFSASEITLGSQESQSLGPNHSEKKLKELTKFKTNVINTSSLERPTSPDKEVNLGAINVPTANQRRRLKKKRTSNQESESEQESIQEIKDKEYRKFKELRGQKKERNKSRKTPLQSQTTVNFNMNRSDWDKEAKLSNGQGHKTKCDQTARGTRSHELKTRSNSEATGSHCSQSETGLGNQEVQPLVCSELTQDKAHCNKATTLSSAVTRTEDDICADIAPGQAVQRRLAAAFAVEDIACSEVELSDSSDSSEHPSLAEIKWKPVDKLQSKADRNEKSLPTMDLHEAPCESPEKAPEMDTPALENGSQSIESEEDADDDHKKALLNQIKDLISLLHEWDEVDQLILRNTGMTDDLLQPLANALIASNSDVETINLNLNNLGPDGAEMIVNILKAKPSINNLLLYGNRLGDEGIKTLMDGLSTLFITCWDLQGGDSVLSPVKNFELTELDIGGNCLTAEGLQSITAFLSLNPPLKYLGLAQCSMDGWEAWEEMFTVLKSNTNITTIMLEDSKLGDDGAILLAETIKVNQSMIMIDLDINDIGDIGGEAIIQSLIFNESSALQNISLDGNPMSMETRDTIQTRLNKLEETNAE